MALPSTLCGKTLHSVRHSAAHPSLRLSFTDGSSYEIRVQNYSPSFSTSTVWSLIQTPGADPVTEHLFSPSNGATIGVSIEVIDCTFITMSDKAFTFDSVQGETKWDQNHVAIAFKFQAALASDAMSLDCIPEAKPRWHCFWASKEEYSDDDPPTSFRSCVHRSYSDVYLHPNGGNLPEIVSSPVRKTTFGASWGKRRGPQVIATKEPSLDPDRTLASRDLWAARPSQRSRTRSRSPTKLSTTGTNRSLLMPTPSRTCPASSSLIARPIPMTRRGSYSVSGTTFQSSSWVEKTAPLRGRDFQKETHSSRPCSPSKLDMSWISSKRGPASPLKISTPRSTSPTKPWISSDRWPDSPTKKWMPAHAVSAQSPLFSSPFQSNSIYQSPSSPTRDSELSTGSSGSSSNLSTPSLTNSTNPQLYDGWIVVEDGRIRAMTADDE